MYGTPCSTIVTNTENNMGDIEAQFRPCSPLTVGEVQERFRPCCFTAPLKRCTACD
ncbi:MAG: hypothetical protein IKM62_01730 [Kiritimatiellae bacterium]|nr:hypothetical protein [Kiritimatiellia bacterium]